MRKFLVCMLTLLISASQANAQASGGQIIRSSNNTTNTKGVKTTKKSEKRKIDDTTNTTSLRPIIQPTPISGLSTYNVVVGSMSILANASGLCQSLRDKGYNSLIYQDNRPEMTLYRITIGSTNNEQEALNMKNQAKSTYPDAWILYVVNGRQERYY